MDLSDLPLLVLKDIDIKWTKARSETKLGCSLRAWVDEYWVRCALCDFVLGVKGRTSGRSCSDCPIYRTFCTGIFESSMIALKSSWNEQLFLEWQIAVSNMLHLVRPEIRRKNYDEFLRREQAWRQRRQSTR